MAIVADFESYPQWNDKVKAVYALARYDDGRPSQRRLDTVVQGMEGAYIQAVYHPSPVQIHTVVQQGDRSPSRSGCSRSCRSVRRCC
jgi:hypothetical protein